MANITGENTVTVQLIAGLSGQITIAELRDWVEYLTQTLMLPDTTVCNSVMFSGKLKLTAEVPANSYQPYVTPV